MGLIINALLMLATCIFFPYNTLYLEQFTSVANLIRVNRKVVRIQGPVASDRVHLGREQQFFSSLPPITSPLTLSSFPPRQSVLKMAETKKVKTPKDFASFVVSLPLVISRADLANLCS